MLRVYVLNVDDQSPEARHSRKLRRIAMWNKEKIIVSIATGVWLVNLSLLLEGSYPLQIKKKFLTKLVISQVSYG